MPRKQPPGGYKRIYVSDLQGMSMVGLPWKFAVTSTFGDGSMPAAKATCHCLGDGR